MSDPGSTGSPTFSIAMCTFNGARYLPEQLSSIAEQARPAVQLVVADDGSEDESVEILRQFAEACSFPVEIIENSSRLGSVRNFEQVLRRCGGDLIALADQDDVWVPEKLDRLAEVFAEPSVQLAFSDADLIDDAGVPLGRTLWERIGFRPRGPEDVSARQLWKGNVVTGATAAVRRSLLDRALSIPEVVAQEHTLYHHDGWLAVMAASRGRVVSVPEPLVSYRIHGDQQVGLGGHAWTSGGRQAVASLLRLRRQHARDSIAWLSAIQWRTSEDLDVSDLDELAAALDHFHTRSTLSAKRLRRIGPVSRELRAGRYAAHAGGWRAAALDLVVPAESR